MIREDLIAERKEKKMTEAIWTELEMLDVLRDRMGIGYEEARTALNLAKGDVIMLWTILRRPVRTIHRAMTLLIKRMEYGTTLSLLYQLLLIARSVLKDMKLRF